MKSLKRYFKRNWILYLMLLPGITLLILFRYWPMYGVSLAFKDYNGFIPISEAPWNGWDNFERLFTAHGFKRALKNSITIGVEKLIFGFPSPIILSLFINSIRNNSIKIIN